MPLPLSTQYLSAKSSWALPFEYQEQHAGMQVRTALTFALAALYRVKPIQAQALCHVVEKFNTASLVHDDIVDQDRTRRGAPSVWVKFGVGTALISGMYGYIDGLQRLSELHNFDLIEIGLKSLEALHIGQYLDTQVSDGDVLPTLGEYRFIAQTNTGCFFLFILESCQYIQALDEQIYLELEALMLELAVYYRYVNDYCDINHTPHFKKKGFAPDLEGGPKSFLMILANNPLIKQKRTDEQKRKIILKFGNDGVFAEAITVMEDSYKQLQQHFETVRTLSDDRNLNPLKAFLNDVHFQQSRSDNYYESLIR
ncbi:polyprenyl synthetase family protein [Pseudomonas sp. Hz4]